jgi:prepilin peptidase CpaA
VRALLVLLPLVLLCGGACVADVRLGRIPNMLNAAGFACGISVSIARAGASGLASSLLGAALGLAVLALPFSLHMVGGGDVKFLAAAGSIIGWQLLWPGFLLGAAVGGALALFALGRRARSVKAFRGNLLLLDAAGWRLSNALAPGDSVEMPYAVPLSVGLVIAAGIYAFI